VIWNLVDGKQSFRPLELEFSEEQISACEQVSRRYSITCSTSSGITVFMIQTLPFDFTRNVMTIWEGMISFVKCIDDTLICKGNYFLHECHAIFSRALHK
jgi:hypothetical protein